MGSKYILLALIMGLAGFLMPGYAWGQVNQEVDVPVYGEAVPDTVVYLTGNRISEGAPDSSVVGVLRLHPKVRERVQGLFLKEDAGGRFGLLKDSLLIVPRSDQLDYERRGHHGIVIAVHTERGDTTEQPYDIEILDANDPPRIEALTANRIPEHGRDSAVVGTFTVTDPDSADHVELTLTDDAEGRFNLRDRTLTVSDTARFNYERQKIHKVTVQAVDRDEATHKRTFRVEILNRNDPPKAVRVAPVAVPEDLEPGSLVGKLRAVDEDSADHHTFRYGQLTTEVLTLRDSLLYLADNYRLDHETQPRIRFAMVARDSSGARVEDTVEIRVTNVNEPPTVFSYGNLEMDEDHVRDYDLRVQDPELSSEFLNLEIVSKKPGLVPEERIRHINRGNRRTLQIRPRADSNGTGTIQVRVSDGEFVDSTEFEVQVRPINDAPYLVRNIERRLDEGARILLKDRYVRVHDVDDPADSLTYEITEAPDYGKIRKDNQGVEKGVFTQRDVMEERIWYQHDGSENHRDTVRFAVTDHEGARLSPFFVSFRMVPINDPPIITDIDDQYILEDHATDPLGFTVEDPETAGINLDVTGVSSDEKVVPDSNIVVKGVDRYRTVEVTPRPDANGDARITVRVDDGKKTDSTSFQLNVAPVNDPPVVKIPDTIRTREDVTAGPVDVRIFDQETDSDQLDIEIEPTNKRLITREGIHLEGVGPDKQLYMSSNRNQYGSSNLVFRVSDGTLADTTQAYFRVKSVNDPPETFSLYNSNLEQNFDSVRVTFRWEQAEDVDDNDIEYIIHLEGTALDTVIKDIRQNSFTFRTIDALKPNDEYLWTVSATDGKDTTQSKSSKQFLTPDLEQGPNDFELYSNYPNPFNPETNIKYKIPVRSRVRVSVYDMSGRMITRLIDEVQTPGDYEVSWNAGDRASGIYVCRIVANSLRGDQQFVETRKMMLVK